MARRDRSRLAAFITGVVYAMAPRRPAHAAAAVIVMLLSIAMPPASHGLPAPHPQEAPLAAGVFLVAKPGMRDPRFQQAVILVTAHNANGTMGLIINHPTQVTISQALPEVKALKARNDTLFIGGPVRPGVLFTVLRSDHPPDRAQHIANTLYLTAGVSSLVQVLAAHDSHASLRSYAGYSGWGGGQLRHEIARGDWLVVDGNDDAIFAEDTGNLWQDIIKAHAGQWI